MNHSITESEVEQVALDILSAQGYGVVHGPDIAPDGPSPAELTGFGTPPPSRSARGMAASADIAPVRGADETLFFSDVIPEGGFEEGYLPVYDLQAVATSFREQTKPTIKGWKPMNDRKVDKNMFIAQVVGKSMEPTIADGSWCLFRFERGGSRNGLVVLVESRQVKDPETGLAFTIKRYHSEKEDMGDGQWKHKKITLSPDNEAFPDIIIDNIGGEEFRVVAEFVGMLE